MSREGNTLSTVLRCAWDGQRTLGTLTKSSPTQATGAHVSVIGHATPADLHRYLQDTEAANGFANRFSIVEVERAQVLPCPGTVDPAVITALADRMRRTLHVARSRGEMRRTPEADIVCKEAYPVLSADRPGMVGDLLARAEAHVLRFSMLYALADGAETIDVPYLESALAIWDVVEESVLSIFAGRTGNTDADRIVAAIGPGERMTRSEISAEIFQRHATAARIDTAIQIVASLPNWRLTVEPTAGRSADVLERLS
jgi:hypothetical protein